jgi:large conductance mechanosensitive channel
MAILQEFKTFISRGNVLDLAVGVIIGAAFGKIVTALTESVIMPLVGWISGGVDFSQYFVRLGPIPVNYKGDPLNYAALKAAGVPMIGYGDFITQVVQFLILAWIVFLIVKAANKFLRRQDDKKGEAGPSEVELLTQIRDELRKREANTKSPHPG